jgi:predicted amidohydrolase YtcJ
VAVAGFPAAAAVVAEAAAGDTRGYCNLFELEPAEINEAKVVMTLFNGRTVHE